MAERKQVGNQMVRATPKSVLAQRMPVIVRALPPAAVERFTQAAFSLAATPNIAECTPDSVVRCIYECARMNLIPDPVMQHAYIVPFRSRGVKQATLIVGYKGLIELARRAEPQLYIHVDRLYEGDDYEFTDGTDTRLVIKRRWWEKGFDDPGEFKASYCVSSMPGQEKRTLVVPRQAALKIATASKSGYQQGSPWYDQFEAMTDKTAVRRSAKLWSLNPIRQESRALAAAVAIDEAGETDDPAKISEQLLGPIPEQPLPDAGERRFGSADESQVDYDERLAQQAEEEAAAAGAPQEEEEAVRAPANPRRQKPKAEPSESLSAAALRKPRTEMEDPDPRSVVRAAPHATKDKVNRDILSEITASAAKRIEEAGHFATDANLRTLITHTCAANKTDILHLPTAAVGTQLIVLGALNMTMPEEVVAVLGEPPDAPPVTPVLEGEHKPSDDEPTPVMKVAAAWAEKRGISQNLAERAVVKYLRLVQSRTPEQFPESDVDALKTLIASEGLKFQLFEG